MVVWIYNQIEYIFLLLDIFNSTFILTWSTGIANFIAVDMRSKFNLTPMISYERC